MSTQPSDGQQLEARPPQPTTPLFVGGSILYNLINNASASDTSPAVNVTGFSRGSLEVTGSGATFSIQLEGSCSQENPDDNSAPWSNLGSAITATGITPVKNGGNDFSGVRWIRAVMTGPATGSLNINLSAVGP